MCMDENLEKDCRVWRPHEVSKKEKENIYKHERKVQRYIIGLQVGTDYKIATTNIMQIDK